MFGDSALRPEKAFSYELGLEKRLGPGSFARVNYFSNLTTDLILWDWQSSTIETRARNVGEAYSNGVEFELVRALKQNGQAFINYTYQQAVDRKDFDPQSEGKDLRYTPRQKFNAGVITGGTGIYLRHVGERYADQYNTIKLPAYTVVDLKFTSQRITLAVDNLFDQQYSEAVGNDPTTFAVRNYPMPGRRYSLGVKLEF
jgi:outer membrane receptor protein involved in Fe transport